MKQTKEESLKRLNDERKRNSASVVNETAIRRSDRLKEPRVRTEALPKPPKRTSSDCAVSK